MPPPPRPEFRTRFAPSPTGPLHLGHAYSAMLAHDMAHAAGGTFLLRIEDIDASRCRPEWEAQIFEDLTWLGLEWPRPVMRQSARHARYTEALHHLWHRGLLYPCTCTRRDIQEAASAPQEGATTGPDGIVYPGTCRPARRPSSPGPMPESSALRLDMRAALASIASTSPLSFSEAGNGALRTIPIEDATLLGDVGDVVLARRDMGTSYHLSVVLDDADQKVSDVLRGADLFEATAIHVLLQRLLDVRVPRYHHHRLIRDDAGKRLAKRDDSRAIAKYRADGATPRDIRQMLNLP